MRASRGEIKIEDVLRAAGLPFAEEYSFDDFNFWTPAPEFPSEIKNCFIIKK